LEVEGLTGAPKSRLGLGLSSIMLNMVASRTPSGGDMFTRACRV
jgi:hypothetical protein